MYIGIIIASAGAVVLIFDLARKTKDGEYDSSAQKVTDGLDAAAQEKLNAVERHLRITKTLIFQSFDFSGGDVKFRRGADGKIRTSQYAYSELFFYTEKQIEKVAVYEYKFSMLEDKHTETLSELPYSELQKANLESGSLKVTPAGLKEECEVSFTDMQIHTTGGKLITFPVKNDADSDAAVDLLNHMIAKREQEQKTVQG